MLNLSAKSNFPVIAAKAEALGKQGRFALAVTLTQIAQDTKKAEQDEMQAKFDRPTRYTLNSLYVKPATKADLESRVWVKDSERPTHYILPEIEGGKRPQKRYEQILKQAGILGQNEVTIPGAGAKIDGYGNMSRGQLAQILSQLKAFNLSGSAHNATDSKRSRAKRVDVQYFVARKGESRQGGGSWKRGEKVQHLPSGIYARTRDGIKPVLVFVDQASYQRRFAFYAVAARTLRANYQARFHANYLKAMVTAKWKP